MPQLILVTAGTLVMVVGFAVLVLAVWIRVAGDRESDMVDAEDPTTLDVQNHVGDPARR